MNEQDKLPISIVSGFLGAGKTTLIRRLLGEPGMAGTAVIINEFGEISLDHLLVKEVAPDVVELPNGCLCCALRGDIIQTLAGLLDLQAEGKARFDHVLIETSGLADPAPIIATVSSHHYLEAAFRMHSVLVVIDGGFGPERYERHPEALGQLLMADAVLISKTDCFPPNEALLALLRDANAAATRLLTEDVTGIVNLLRGQAISGARRFPPAMAVAEHGLGISSVSLALTKSFSRLAFAQALGALTSEQGEDILRVKGIVRFSDSERPGAAIHAVQHTLYPPEWLTSWPDDDIRGRLVIIGMNLDPMELVERFSVAGAALWSAPIHQAA
jgi:G3E family GTPase